MKTPIAWRNLTHNKRKLAVAIAGVAFAVVLMFQQTGFENALFDSTVEVVKQTRCDLLLLNPARFSLSSELRFNRNHLQLAAGVEGIKSAHPLFIDNTVALFHAEEPTNPPKPRPIRVLGVDPKKALFHSVEITAQMPKLEEPDTALIDRLSKPEFGFSFQDRQLVGNTQGSLLGHPLEMVGTFKMGRDFAHEGNLIVSQKNFSKYFQYRGADPLAVVDLGLIQLDDPGESDLVLRRLGDLMPEGVTVVTKEDFIQREVGFWSASTPIGIIFKIGTVMGFLVGTIICYQILATDISDHLSELATLKAMGYGTAYFRRLVITESLILSGLGFVPGLLLSLVVFEINAQATGLIMAMTVPRAMFILLLTILMCLISGWFAMKKLISADPASLF